MKKLANPGAAQADDAPVSSPESAYPVRRIRSHHHRHRRFRMEKLDDIRRREDVRALAFILPLIILVIGISLFCIVFRNNDPELRPEKLLSLAWVLSGLGGGWFLLSALFGAIKSWQDSRRRAKDDREDDAEYDEYRRSHRRHHHHHHHHHAGSSDGGGEE